MFGDSFLTMCDYKNETYKQVLTVYGCLFQTSQRPVMLLMQKTIMQYTSSLKDTGANVEMHENTYSHQ